MAEVSFDKDLLDHLLNILGYSQDELVFFLPYYEANPGAAEDIQDISSRGLHATNITAYDAVPVIRGLMRSTRLNGTDEHQEIADNILLSAIASDGQPDVAASWGLALKMDAANAANKNLISKWDDQTPNVEWRIFIDANEYPSIEVMDNNVVLTNMGREDQTALLVDTWYILIFTYSGVGGPAPEAGMNIYKWSAPTRLWEGAVDDADIDGGGVYIDMENTAQPVMIGAADVVAGPVPGEYWDGEIAMPWMTRKELSAAEAELAALDMVRLLGL